MSPIPCPKCSVVAHETASALGDLSHPRDASICETPSGERRESWNGALLFAVAMPDEIFWPGQSCRDYVMQIAEQAQAKAKEEALEEDPEA